MNQKQVIATNDAPKAIGPYSQAIRANGFIFVSGQTPIDPATQQLISGTVGEQTERVLRNIEAILKQAGSSMAKIVRCGVFLKDMNDFAAMNEVYATFFPTDPPARSTIQAARLPKDCQVEIDAIALEETQHGLLAAGDSPAALFPVLIRVPPRKSAVDLRHVRCRTISLCWIFQSFRPSYSKKRLNSTAFSVRLAGFSSRTPAGSIRLFWPSRPTRYSATRCLP